MTENLDSDHPPGTTTPHPHTPETSPLLSGPPTDDTIRVLHVDDDPEFTAMTAEFLERTHDHLTVETSQSPREALDRLDDVDCILSDFDMPELDGLAFLDRVNAEHPSLPFILFTGKGSEQIASEAISAGVTDYLQKSPSPDQFTLLANRITNAVARQRARTTYRRIFHEVTTPITIHDPGSGRILDANEQFCDLLGYDCEQLVGATVEQFSAIEKGYTEAAAQSHIEQAIEQGPHRFEWVDQTSNGDAVPVEVTLQPIRLSGRECLLASVRDISERKAHERELNQLSHYQEMVEGLNDGLCLLDTSRRIVAVNEALTRITGYEQEELLEAPLATLLASPDIERFRQQRTGLAENADETATMIADIQTNEGGTVACEVRVTPRPTADGVGTIALLRPSNE